MIQKLTGSIHIGRFHGTEATDPAGVVIQVLDGASRCQVLEVRMSAADLIDALQSRTSPCVLELTVSPHIGATQEVKRELVPFDAYHQARSARGQAIQRELEDKALAPFEVDGWKGDRDGLWNAHGRRQGPAGPAQEVVFRRYVRDGQPVEVDRG